MDVCSDFKVDPIQLFKMGRKNDKDVCSDFLVNPQTFNDSNAIPQHDHSQSPDLVFTMFFCLIYTVM